MTYMILNNDDQYFLIVDKLDLFPELSQSPSEMIEQIMNALLLSSNNIYTAIKSIVELQKITSKMLNNHIVDILTHIKSFLTLHHLSFCQGESVRGFYPRYNNKSLNYRDIGKQLPMNIEFALQKKISFVNRQIKFEESFYLYVYELIEKQRKTETYNRNDSFIEQIESMTLSQYVKTLEIIKHEANKFKRKLQNEK